MTEDMEMQEDVKEVVDGVHGYGQERDWVKPEDPVLLEKLEWFQDQKLGLMMHWGPYSQLGVVESWALSDEDASWSRKDIPWIEDSESFKKQYFHLNETFNPIAFQPEKWAELASQSGFKYVIFTTKHHDGFCMWDTKATDYRITAPDCPFHTHRYADVCKHVFDAFRNKGMGIAAYFSKADWHTPYYWAPGMARGNASRRGPSYEPKEHPDLWNRFIDFTHEQIMELVGDYGPIDVLWLDAGWVSKASGQDIRLGEVVEKARKIQPGLLVVDRTVGGIYENYVTPEQTVPAKPMLVPWESCITLGTSFSFKYGDQYKSLRELVHLLIDVVAKGGNLALNIGPQPDGRFPAGAVKRLEELGEWLAIHGEAIYGTRVCSPYRQGPWAFTRKAKTVYAFHLYTDGAQLVQEQVFLPYRKAAAQIDLLGGEDALEFTQTGAGITITLPLSAKNTSAPIAHVFRIQPLE